MVQSKFQKDDIEELVEMWTRGQRLLDDCKQLGERLKSTDTLRLECQFDQNKKLFSDYDRFQLN